MKEPSRPLRRRQRLATALWAGSGFWPASGVVRNEVQQLVDGPRACWEVADQDTAGKQGVLSSPSPSWLAGTLGHGMAPMAALHGPGGQSGKDEHGPVPIHPNEVPPLSMGRTGGCGWTDRHTRMTDGGAMDGRQPALTAKPEGEREREGEKGKKKRQANQGQADQGRGREMVVDRSAWVGAWDGVKDVGVGYSRSVERGGVGGPSSFSSLGIPSCCSFPSPPRPRFSFLFFSFCSLPLRTWRQWPLGGFSWGTITILDKPGYGQRYDIAFQFTASGPRLPGRVDGYMQNRLK